MRIEVLAVWDDEASVWVATSEHVPGLVAEAATQDELESKLLQMIPELLELNGAIQPENSVPTCLLYQEQRMLMPA